jgi:hypothetical protein
MVFHHSSRNTSNRGIKSYKFRTPKVPWIHCNTVTQALQVQNTSNTGIKSYKFRTPKVPWIRWAPSYCEKQCFSQASVYPAVTFLYPRESWGLMLQGGNSQSTKKISYGRTPLAPKPNISIAVDRNFQAKRDVNSGFLPGLRLSSLFMFCKAWWWVFIWCLRLHEKVLPRMLGIPTGSVGALEADGKGEERRVVNDPARSCNLRSCSF